MHSNWRMLEWVGIPGDTGTFRIAWRGWKVMNDGNVRNVSGVSEMSGKTGMSGMSGKTGMSVMTGCLLEGLAAECLECSVEHTDGFLEDLLAFYV